MRMNSGRYLAEMLRAYGIDHCFFIDAIMRRALVPMEEVGIKRILGHTEKAVAYMADGYARVAKRPSFCMAQSVGAFNLASGLQDAYLGQSPVVAMTGRHAAHMQYRHSYQELPHQPMFEAVTKFDAKVESAEQFPVLLRQAFRAATTGTPRPVHLDVAGHSGDVLATMEADFTIAADADYTRFPPHRPRPDPEMIKRAAALIAKSQRPVIVADRGATISGAEDAITALAEKINAPVAATPDAKLVMVDSHPLFAGIVGIYGRSCTNHIVAEADLVIYCGSTVNDHATCNWTLPKIGTDIIQIDIDPAELGRNYPGIVGINADVRTATEALTAAVAPKSATPFLARAQSLVKAWWAEVDVLRKTDAIPMRAERLCLEVANALPADAILVVDTGFATVWGTNFIDQRQRTQMFHRAAGSLGWAFPAAMGAKCAAPGRPVIAFTGDGGFYYHMAEMETARRWGINTVTVINNNVCLAQGMRAIHGAYEGNNGNKAELYDFHDTDFVAVARAFDCHGERVDKPADFPRAFEAALKSGKPAILDVRTEHAAQAPMPWTPNKLKSYGLDIIQQE